MGPTCSQVGLPQALILIPPPLTPNSHRHQQSRSLLSGESPGSLTQVLQPHLPLAQIQFLTKAPVESRVQKCSSFHKVSCNLLTCLAMCPKYAKAEGAKTSRWPYGC